MAVIDLKRSNNYNPTDVKLPLPPPLPSQITCTSAYITAAEESSGNGTAVPCYSPRVILSRWLHRHDDGGEAAGCRVLPRRCGKQKRKNVEREKAAVLPPPTGDCRRIGDRQPAAEVTQTTTPGRKPGEISSNLALSIALAFLLGRGATEIKKMSEMRREMEVFIKDFKDEFQKRDTSSSFIDSNRCSHSYSAANYSENENSTSIQFQNYRALVRIVSERERTYAGFVRSKGDLEAELEVELEQLQLKVEEGSSSSVVPDNHMKGVASETESATEASSVSYVVETEHKEDETSKYDGVSPRELERRLHKLLQAQQQERIQELEFLLERAESRLRERDVELRWWRDTAKLALQHKDRVLLR